MSLPIYVDLDDTLVFTKERPSLSDLVSVRPNAEKFLETLAEHGSVFILSHATLPHIERCLALMPVGSRALSGIFSRVDLEPIEEIVAEVMGASPLITESEHRALGKLVTPIAPPGVVLDDQPVGSYYYALKSFAVGIGPRLWINVDPYLDKDPNDDGLARAYRVFRNRFIEPATLAKIA